MIVVTIFHLCYEPNRIPFGLESNEKLSLRSYSYQFGRNQKNVSQIAWALNWAPFSDFLSFFFRAPLIYWLRAPWRSVRALNIFCRNSITTVKIRSLCGKRANRDLSPNNATEYECVHKYIVFLLFWKWAEFCVRWTAQQNKTLRARSHLRCFPWHGNPFLRVIEEAILRTEKSY